MLHSCLAFCKGVVCKEKLVELSSETGLGVKKRDTTPSCTHTHTPAGCTAASHCLPGDTEGRDVEERVGGYAPGRHIKLLAGQRSSEQACVTQRFSIQQLSMQERASR